MSTLRFLSRFSTLSRAFKKNPALQQRFNSGVQTHVELYDPDPEVLSQDVNNEGPIYPPDFRQKYPEFLPDPDVKYRNPLREKLERMDMLRRRGNVAIPQFYVGSILAVTTADKNAPEKTTRFVGLCILRAECGLRSQFILRNVVDNQGVEIIYDLYSPVILDITVLKLEKWLDERLFYLRDAPLEYSKIPFDMKAVYHPAGTPIPINTNKVTLNPRPWIERYERHDYQNARIVDLPEQFYRKAARSFVRSRKVDEKWDIMDQYRMTIPAEEQDQVFSEIADELLQYEKMQTEIRRKALSVKKSKKK